MGHFRIGKKVVGGNYPTYFIAEIGANHSGRIQRAKDLIYMAKAAGADATKFQHYRADTLASKYGFSRLSSLAHYSDNPHSVFRQYEVPWDWTPILKEYCDSLEIEFMSTPYDLEAVEHLDPYVNAFKIGSGDITYTELIAAAARTGKPVILSTGAADQHDVDIAYAAAAMLHPNVGIMQCNTNYEISAGKYRNLNLHVLRSYRKLYPSAVLGFSDHGTRVQPVLGAVALGARLIERHFTDVTQHNSPDSPFATTPIQFQRMVEDVRDLEDALGSVNKFVCPNERETVILQRRCLRANRTLPAGTILSSGDIVALRPAPPGSFKPYETDFLVGKKLNVDVVEGEDFREDMF